MGGFLNGLSAAVYTVFFGSLCLAFSSFLVAVSARYFAFYQPFRPPCTLLPHVLLSALAKGSSLRFFFTKIFAGRAFFFSALFIFAAFIFDALLFSFVFIFSALRIIPLTVICVSFSFVCFRLVLFLL